MPRIQATIATTLALAALLSCSPTGSDRGPVMLGPDEIVGVWNQGQIVCTVPVTIQTPYPIAVTGGDVRVVFPAEGIPKASIERDFTVEELGALWGGGIERSTTRSIEINPLVQFEDYETTLHFTYSGTRGTGSVRHVFRCRGEGEPAGAGG